jgi:hypothetical protein
VVINIAMIPAYREQRGDRREERGERREKRGDSNFN